MNTPNQVPRLASAGSTAPRMNSSSPIAGSTAMTNTERMKVPAFENAGMDTAPPVG